METISYLGYHLNRQPNPTDSFVMLPIDTQDYNLIVPKQPVQDDVDQSKALLQQHRALMKQLPKREESAVVRTFIGCIISRDVRTQCEEWLDKHHWVWDEVEAFFKSSNTANQVENGPPTCASAKQAHLSEVEPESQLPPAPECTRRPPSRNARRMDSTSEPADPDLRQGHTTKDLLQQPTSTVKCQCRRIRTDRASNIEPAIAEINVPCSPQNYDPTVATRELQQVTSLQSSVNIDEANKTTCSGQSFQTTTNSIDHDDYVLPSPLLGSSAAVRFQRPVGLHKRTSTKPNHGLRDVSEPQSHMFAHQDRREQSDNRSPLKVHRLGLDTVYPNFAKTRDPSMYESAHLFHLLEGDGPPEEPVTKEFHQYVHKLNAVPNRVELARHPRKSLTLVNLDSNTSPIEHKKTNQFQQRVLDPRTFLYKRPDEGAGGSVSRKVMKAAKPPFRQGRERLRPLTPVHPARAPRMLQLRDSESKHPTEGNNAAEFGIMISERVKRRRHQRDQIPPNKKRSTRQISILSSSS